MEMWEINDLETVRDELSEQAQRENLGEVSIFKQEDETVSIEDKTLCYSTEGKEPAEPYNTDEMYQTILELERRGHIGDPEEIDYSPVETSSSEDTENYPYGVTD